MSSFWTAIGALSQSLMNQAQATAYIQNYSYVNDSLVCCSVNAYALLTQGKNSMSYFFLGANS